MTFVTRLLIYSPTTVGPEMCVQMLLCVFFAEGERFLVGWSVHGHFSHTKWATPTCRLSGSGGTSSFFPGRLMRSSLPVCERGGPPGVMIPGPADPPRVPRVVPRF